MNFCILFSPAEVKGPVISIPFIINMNAQGDNGTIIPTDIELIINGEKRDILDVKRIKRNLKIKSDLAKDFIISFSLSDPDEYIEQGLSYFLTEILTPSDSLSIVTPGKVFRVRVTPNKEGMHNSIIKLLKQECREYKKKKHGFSKSIGNELTKILNVLADDVDTGSTFLVRKYKKVIGFLNSFPVEFNRFLKFTIVLNEVKFDSAISDISFRSGEKWWFHFHRRESVKLFSRINKAIKEIENYGSKDGDLFSGGHAARLKQLKLLRYSIDFFPVEQIKEKMIQHGIGFFSVVYNSSGDKEDSASGSNRSVYDLIFESIAKFTGGKSVYAVDPEDGIKRASAESFIHYKANFFFDGKIEDKSITLRNLKGKGGVYYPSRITSREMEKMIEYLSSEKCRIRDLVFSGKKVSFNISGYKSLPKQDAGLLKVRFEIFSMAGKLLHRKENILRSPVKDLLLQIPFPLKIAGNFKVNILVIDLVENYKTEKNIIVKSE